MEFLHWLYWLTIFLFFAGSFYLLHIPLPHDISDRSKLAVAEFLLRLSNEYLGDLFENVFGAEIRNKVTRFIMGIGFLIPMKPPKGIIRTRTRIQKVSCITYDIDKKKSDGLIVFIHGGGWCVGESRYYDGIIYQLVEKIGCCAVSIDYRLAPEHPFPAGLDDCSAVVNELYNNGCPQLQFNNKKILIAGDSAGGNLAAVVCQRFQKDQKNVLMGQVLIYPVIHVFNFQSESYQDYWKKYAGTALLNPKHMARWILLYLGLDASKENIKKVMNSQHVTPEFAEEKQNSRWLYRIKEKKPEKKVDYELAEKFIKIGANPDVSPLFGNTEGLPPALVLTAGYDVLKDEGIQYAEKLKSSGVRTTWRHFPRAFHGLFNMPNSTHRTEMMQEVVDFANELF
uniref:Alpha/beta hydrolase fold-3 domain-containing protein n=1 Tax=Caenorhabditis japonica TaxID=281687 RepID=A0A8R1DQ44_CAEJA